MLVQDIKLGIGDRSSDRNRAVAHGCGTDAMETGERRVLGRAVGIDQLAAVEVFQCLAHVRHREHVAARQKLAEFSQAWQLRVHHFME